MMNKYGRTVHTLCGLGLLFIILRLTRHQYDWMREMTPSIPAGVIEDASMNSAVFVTVLLGTIILVQSFLVFSARKMRERIGKYGKGSHPFSLFFWLWSYGAFAPRKVLIHEFLKEPR
ncbi:MAG: hypothetical protein LBJ59_10535 [Zoogloeaceae bacterium]|jgi:hypothetical protein|nr:hypothetical protein [Zoogloeaceae bacterium]